MRSGQVLEVAIENFAREGKCVTRHNGLVIFIPGVVPGDTARIRITKLKQNFAEGVPLSILEPSRLRTSPPCKYFGICGGCTWQNVQYDTQLEMKRQNVIDAFERIGGFKGIDIASTIPSPEIYFYRNKIELSFSPEAKPTESLEEGENLARGFFSLGFHQAGRYDKLVDIEECLLQSEQSNEILGVVRDFCQRMHLDAYDSRKHSGYLRFLIIREGRNTGDRMVNLVTFDDRPNIVSQLCAELLRKFPSLTTFVNTINSRRAQIAHGEIERVYHGDGTIHEKIGNYRFRISANSFFQTNTKQAEKIFDLVKDLAELKRTYIVYDLYSGAGAFSIYISEAVQKVIGIELTPSAVNDARHNASLNRVDNCYFLQGDLKEKLTRETHWMGEYGTPQVFLLDPPRSGIHAKVLQAIARMSPPTIIYVSCNPATQARDIRFLSDSGYKLQHIQPVDLFPQTMHLESIAKLARKP